MRLRNVSQIISRTRQSRRLLRRQSTVIAEEIAVDLVADFGGEVEEFERSSCEGSRAGFLW